MKFRVTFFAINGVPERWVGQPASQQCPTEPFRNIRASRSGDRQILCTFVRDGFLSSKVVKVSVGWLDEVTDSSSLFPDQEAPLSK